ncbi:MAG: tRNA pseudouridine(38-40) synthase TruA [Bacteroidales bacterium]|nr:tRNA pseudouridine(38-40) synthase TruA [Bacteroidales bacterium]
MTRYFIKLSYSGKNFNGWQIQPNDPSVQETIEKVLSTLLGEAILVVGAGRTDAGVHARNYIAHFDVTSPILNLSDFMYKANRFVHKDIVFHDIALAQEPLHSRFSATKRTYRYYIHQQKDPFLEGFSVYVHYKLDVELMNRAGEILLQYSDFTSFSKLHTDAKTNTCAVSLAQWHREGHRLIFTIAADRFLRNMVRAIVGTMLELGRGKITFEQFRSIIELKDRGKAGTSAPPDGLFLEQIDYDCTIFDK